MNLKRKVPSGSAYMDGGTEALKATRRFASAPEGAPSPLSRGGGSGTAARSRATYRRANHRLAATWIAPGADQSWC